MIIRQSFKIDVEAEIQGSEIVSSAKIGILDTSQSKIDMYTVAQVAAEHLMAICILNYSRNSIPGEVDKLLETMCFGALAMHKQMVARSGGNSNSN